jgi:hypothetical protein
MRSMLGEGEGGGERERERGREREGGEGGGGEGREMKSYYASIIININGTGDTGLILIS